MVDILHIKANALIVGDVLAPADLPQAGDTRAHGEPLLCIFAVARQLAGMNDARPHEGHLPNQDVEQLRQFIQACFSQKLPHPGNARITNQLHILLVFPQEFGMLCQEFIGIANHGAKLQGIEAMSMQADNFAKMEDRASVIKLDAEGNDDEHRHQDNDARDRQYNIKQALDYIVQQRGFLHYLSTDNAYSYGGRSNLRNWPFL